MKRGYQFGLVIMLLGGLALSQTYVSPGEGTLSAAIAAAQDGDVLLLIPGAEYTETALSRLGTLVDKNLKIAVDGEQKAIVRMLKDLPIDSTGVFFRLGNNASLALNGLELDGNSKINYLVSFYMPVTQTQTLIKKVQIKDCYVHDLTGNILHGQDSDFTSYLVVDSTLIDNTVFQRSGTIVHYRYCGSNYISLTNSTIATCNSYGLRVSGCASDGSLLPENTPKVVIDHTTWYEIGTDDPREIILGDRPPLLRPWTVTNSILVNQVSRSGPDRRTFINIKDNATSGESCMGTITNICFWKIDKIAFYMHTVRDTIRMDPQFADTNNYDFTLPAGSPLLTFGTDGKPIGDPRWGTNYVNAIQPQTENLPAEFALAPVYPNPFNPTATVSFSLPVGGLTKLVVYDLQGREVRAMVNEHLNAGEYHFSFDGSGLQSGVYLCRLIFQGQISTRKMVLLK